MFIYSLTVFSAGGVRVNFWCPDWTGQCGQGQGLSVIIGQTGSGLVYSFLIGQVSVGRVRASL